MSHKTAVLALRREVVPPPELRTGDHISERADPRAAGKGHPPWHSEGAQNCYGKTMALKSNTQIKCGGGPGGLTQVEVRGEDERWAEELCEAG